VASHPARAREMRAALSALWPGGAAAPRAPAGEGPHAAPAAAGSGVSAASRERLLGEALAALRQSDGPRARTALEDLRRSVTAGGRPAPPGLLSLLGGALRLQGRVGEALAIYEEALHALRSRAPAADVAPAGAHEAAAVNDAPALPAVAEEAPAGAADPIGDMANGAAPLEALLLSDIAACRRLEGRLALAAEAYRASVRARPDDPWDRLALADVLIETGETGEAIDELRGALTRAPGEAELLAALGRAYLAAGQAGAAILPLQDALRAAPGMTRPWFDLGRAYEDLGRPSDALRAYQDFTARVPAPGDPLYQKAAERVQALRAGV
jgi:tetratricopeptide (TPR) repeat protein